MNPKNSELDRDEPLARGKPARSRLSPESVMRRSGTSPGQRAVAARARFRCGLTARLLRLWEPDEGILGPASYPGGGGSAALCRSGPSALPLFAIPRNTLSGPARGDVDSD